MLAVGLAGAAAILLACNPVWAASHNDAGPAATTASANIQFTIDSGHLTLQAEGAPLAEVVTRICKQAGIKFTLQGDLVRPVNRIITNRPLDSAIADLLGNTSFVMIYGLPAGADTPQLLEVRASGQIIGSTGSRARSEGPFAEDNSVAAKWARRAVTLGFDLEPAEDMDLFTDLVDLEAGERLYAMQWLASQGNGEAIEALGRFLALDKDPAIRSEAALALGTLGGQAATQNLSRALGDADPDVRFQIVEAIGKTRGAETTLVLGQILFGDPDPENRISALQSLHRIGDEAAGAFLAAAAKDSDPAVRQVANDMMAIWGLDGAN